VNSNDRHRPVIRKANQSTALDVLTPAQCTLRERQESGLEFTVVPGSNDFTISIEEPKKK
jgi:hypothetical protein